MSSIEVWYKENLPKNNPETRGKVIKDTKTEIVKLGARGELEELKKKNSNEIQKLNPTERHFCIMMKFIDDYKSMQDAYNKVIKEWNILYSVLEKVTPWKTTKQNLIDSQEKNRKRLEDRYKIFKQYCSTKDIKLTPEENEQYELIKKDADELFGLKLEDLSVLESLQNTGKMIYKWVEKWIKKWVEKVQDVSNTIIDQVKLPKSITNVINKTSNLAWEILYPNWKESKDSKWNIIIEYFNHKDWLIKEIQYTNWTKEYFYTNQKDSLTKIIKYNNWTSEYFYSNWKDSLTKITKHENWTIEYFYNNRIDWLIKTIKYNNWSIEYFYKNWNKKLINSLKPESQKWELKSQKQKHEKQKRKTDDPILWLIPEINKWEYAILNNSLWYNEKIKISRINKEWKRAYEISFWDQKNSDICKTPEETKNVLLFAQKMWKLWLWFLLPYIQNNQFKEYINKNLIKLGKSETFDYKNKIEDKEYIEFLKIIWWALMKEYFQGKDNIEKAFTNFSQQNKNKTIKTVIEEKCKPKTLDNYIRQKFIN
jgi:hypothetical protein